MEMERSRFAGYRRIVARGRHITLTFVRAFWMAILPATPELPPGEKAFLAKDSNGVPVLGLFDDGDQV